jgi:hypothetical protein
MFCLIRGCRSVFIGMTALAFLMPIPHHALAASIDAQASKTEHDPDQFRTRLTILFAREDMRVALIQHGINPAEVEARLAAMTDKEASQPGERVGELTAAGNAAVVFPIWLVALILLGCVLVITGVITLGAHAGVQIDQQKEQGYGKTTPFPLHLG